MEKILLRRILIQRGHSESSPMMLLTGNTGVGLLLVDHPRLMVSSLINTKYHLSDSVLIPSVLFAFVINKVNSFTFCMCAYFWVAALYWLQSGSCMMQ